MSVRILPIAVCAAMIGASPVLAGDTTSTDSILIEAELPDGRSGPFYVEVGAAAAFLDGGEFNFGDVGGGVDDFRGSNDIWGGGIEVRKGYVFDVSGDAPAWFGERPRIEYGFSWAEATQGSSGLSPIGATHTAIDGSASAVLGTSNVETSDFDHTLWSMDVLLRTDFTVRDGDVVISPLFGITGGDRHQEWRYVSFTPGLMAPADSRIAEKVDMWFLGPTFGATATIKRREDTTVFLGARASVLYAETEFNGRHDAFVGVPLLFTVNETDTEWIWRFTADLGVTKQVGRATVEVRGELDYWDYVAGVDNPITTGAPASIDPETSLGWRILFVVRIPLGQ